MIGVLLGLQKLVFQTVAHFQCVVDPKLLLSFKCHHFLQNLPHFVPNFTQCLESVLLLLVLETLCHLSSNLVSVAVKVDQSGQAKLHSSRLHLAFHIASEPLS